MKLSTKSFESNGTIPETFAFAKQDPTTWPSFSILFGTNSACSGGLWRKFLRAGNSGKGSGGRYQRAWFQRWRPARHSLAERPRVHRTGVRVCLS